MALVKMKNNGDKMEKPKVYPGQWIWVQSRECVVCQEFQDTSIADIEVVHMDQGKATNRDAKWNGEKWIFAGGDMGGYADSYSRLSEFVSKLRRGRQHHLGE